MIIDSKGNLVPTLGRHEPNVQTRSSDALAPSGSAPARYYFNLANGETMIRDEEGIEAPSVQAAAIFAMQAIEELRVDDPTGSDEWQGWRLEVVDASGRAVQTIPLDALSAH